MFIWLLYLLVAGIVAFVANRMVSRGGRAGPGRGYWSRYGLALATWALPLLCIRFGVSTIWRPVNFVTIVISAGAWLYFSFASFSIRPREAGILIGSLLTAPVFLALAVFPFAGLGIMFIASDIAQGYDVTRMPNGFVCQSRVSGSAFTESDQTFELLRPILGILQVRVQGSSYILNESQGSTSEQECPALLEEYENARGHR
jgi:hypothetical protein